MSKYLIKVGISHSIESTLVHDLNELADFIYSAGGNIVNLNVKSRARQIWVYIDAQATVLDELLETKSIKNEFIRSIYEIEEPTRSNGNQYIEELSFAGFFQSRNILDSQAVLVYPS